MNDLRIHHVAFVGESLSVNFTDGRSVAVPIRFFPRLLAATSAERERWQIIGRGLGVHWETLDEDLSVENILLAYSRTKKTEYSQVAHAWTGVAEELLHLHPELAGDGEMV